MAALEAGALIVGALCVAVMLSLPVAFAFLLISIFGMMILVGGDAGFKQIVLNGADAVTNFSLLPLPMFFLMGELFFRTGLAHRVFDALDALFGNVQARLSYITVAGGTIFAALTGSSLGNSARLGASLAPEMVRRGYKRHMALGPIVAAGGVGMLIPPSVLAVLFGSIARIDIGRLLLAGLLPGLILALLYAAAIWTMARLDPDAAPRGPGIQPRSMKDVVRMVAVNLLPMLLIVGLVLFVIVYGIATPTEAAAFGVLGVLCLALAFRCLTIQSMIQALQGTVAVSGRILMIIIGSSTFGQVLALSGATQAFVGLLSDLEIGRYGFLLLVLVLLLFLGMIMEPLSIMLLTVPILFPAMQVYGFDPIWFGIFMLLMIEISLATPPFGLLLFVMQGAAPKGTTLLQVVRASLPFVGCDLVCVGIITAFPIVVLLLPGLMD